jgi:hypothetical protein
MKVKTREDYTKKMARRRPEPKKGKKRKNLGSVAKESNAALSKELAEERESSARAISALEFTLLVMDKALGMACAKCPHPPEHYCAEAEKRIIEKMEAENGE